MARNTDTVLLTALALLMVGVGAFHNLANWPVRLAYPGDENYGGDSLPLVDPVHLRRGVPIYAEASGERYDAANWGPLFYLLGSELVDPDKPSYLPLRLLSMIGTLGCAAGCALLAFWFSRRYLAAVLAPLLFLSYGFVGWNGVSSRPDTVALGLWFAGFLIAYRFRYQRAMLLSVPLMLLGVYYQQQYVAGPLAILFFLLLERRYRLAFEFAGLLALGAVVLLVFFQYVVFAGQAFLHHFIFYNLMPFTFGDLLSGAGFFALALLVPLLVGIRSVRVQPDRLLTCYMASATLVSLGTVGRAGSGRYYFYECGIILSVLFAALVSKRITEGRPPLALMLLLGLSLVLDQPLTPAPPQEKDFVLDHTLQAYLKQHFAPQTPALAYYSGELMRAGLETPISNIYRYAWLVRQGVIPDESLVNQIRNHRFGAIVLSSDLESDQDGSLQSFFLTEPMRQAILENYQLNAILEMPESEKIQAEDRFHVWVPRN